MSKEELGELIAAEEKRLGVGSNEFLQRHNEIMGQIDSLMEKGAIGNDKTDCDRKRRYGGSGSVRK